MVDSDIPNNSNSSEESSSDENNQKQSLEQEYYRDILNSSSGDDYLHSLILNFSLVITMTLFKIKVFEQGNSIDKTLEALLKNFCKAEQDLFDYNIAMHNIMSQTNLGKVFSMIYPDSKYPKIQENHTKQIEKFKKLITDVWTSIDLSKLNE